MGGGKVRPAYRSGAELVGLRVDVITTLSTPAALAARNATTTIPIVVDDRWDVIETLYGMGYRFKEAGPTLVDDSRA